MKPDDHSDDFATARQDDVVSLRSAAQEARATLYAVLNRLELNDIEGERETSITSTHGVVVRISGLRRQSRPGSLNF